MVWRHVATELAVWGLGCGVACRVWCVQRVVRARVRVRVGVGVRVGVRVRVRHFYANPHFFIPRMDRKTVCPAREPGHRFPVHRFPGNRVPVCPFSRSMPRTRFT